MDIMAEQAHGALAPAAGNAWKKRVRTDPAPMQKRIFVKKTKKLVPQVLLRRMILVLLDAAIVIFSFYFALLLRADGAVEASWWPHNRALLYQNLPWIVALYLLSF